MFGLVSRCLKPVIIVEDDHNIIKIEIFSQGLHIVNSSISEKNRKNRKLNLPG